MRSTRARAARPNGAYWRHLDRSDLLAFGSEEQKAKPATDSRWCGVLESGYSEPGASPILAAIRTKAVQDEASGQWKITGQRCGPPLAHESDFVFVLARVDSDSSRHHGLGFSWLRSISRG